MEGDRFDVLVKRLSQSVARRRLASGLLAGALASLLTDGEGAARPRRARRGRGHVSPVKHKTKSGCPKKAFKRCTTPAAKIFLAAIEACQAACAAGAQGADCQACLGPLAADLGQAAETCAVQVCHGGPGSGGGTGAATSTRHHAAAPPDSGSCQFAQLNDCYQRRDRDAAICAALAAAACLGSEGLGCGAAVAACLAQAGTGFADCGADFGCKTGGVCLPGDVCCPHNTDTPCSGVCCPSPQTCVDGSCSCADACGAGCPCQKGETCSNSQCCPTKLLLPGGVCCPEAERCGPTRTEVCCADPLGRNDCCGGQCTDTKTDPANCGTCGHQCQGSNPTCQQGVCQVQGNCCPGGTCCGSGWDCCNGQCLDASVGPWTECGANCCRNDQECCNGQCMRKGFGPYTPCGNTCCPDPTHQCCNGQCWPKDQGTWAPCGDRACYRTEYEQCCGPEMPCQNVAVCCPHRCCPNGYTCCGDSCCR